MTTSEDTMNPHDEDCVPRPEMEALFRAFKAEVKTALTRQTLLIVGSAAYIKSDLSLPKEVTIGAIALFGAKFAAGLASR